MTDTDASMSRTRERLILAAILLTITVVYLWDISQNGWSNAFYAAAVQSGSESWKAWFFGSFDPQNYVTVDKPAGGLWLMGLSARLFGFSSASMLIPQAILAIASAALIRAAVRRQAGPGAGLLAAALFALIPVVSVMFRHSNPDAPMVFGMVLAAYFTTRAIDSKRSRSAAGWLALAGAGIGFAFLCKTLEGLLVAPALLLAYLVSAKWPWKTTLLHILGAGVALLASSGWWMAAVALTPAASRPYVDNSTDNSEWTLAVGYNGLDRLLGGDSQGMGGDRGSGPGFSGTPGIFRLFQDTQADHIAWLLPTAFIALILGVIIAGKTPQTGGWLGRARAVTTNPAGQGWFMGYLDGVQLRDPELYGQAVPPVLHLGHGPGHRRLRGHRHGAVVAAPIRADRHVRAQCPYAQCHRHGVRAAAAHTDMAALAAVGATDRRPGGGHSAHAWRAGAKFTPALRHCDSGACGFVGGIDRVHPRQCHHAEAGRAVDIGSGDRRGR